MIIAIDGKSGTGKSSAATAVSEILGWICVKTGDIYRQIVYMALQKKIDCSKEEEVKKLLVYSVTDNCLQLSGYAGDNAIHSEEFAQASAVMAASVRIKDVVNRSIQTYVQGKNAVVEGRNVATSMFPNSIVKVLLFADIETRTKRKIKQLENNSDPELVRESLLNRDRLIPSSNNGHYDILIDTSTYDVEDTVSQIIRTFCQRTHTRSLIELKHFLFSSYQKDTAYSSCAEEWSHNNPTRGQCAITSMLVYELFGGEIQRGYNMKEKEWHYWNVIDGIVYDFTIDQYKDNNLSFESIQRVNFYSLLENIDTKRRYELLKKRVTRTEKIFWETNDLILQCKKCCNAHSPAFETVSLGTKCEILVVGEAPAKNGWRVTGKAWTNRKGSIVPTGKILQKLLNRIGLDINEISYMEAIKCYPEQGKVTRKHAVNCRDYCYKQIDILRPRIILSMGKHATEYLLGSEDKFSDKVGNVYSMATSNGIYTVIPIYHTSPASPLSYKGNLEVFERIRELIKK